MQFNGLGNSLTREGELPLYIRTCDIADLQYRTAEFRLIEHDGYSGSHRSEFRESRVTENQVLSDRIITDCEMYTLVVQPEEMLNEGQTNGVGLAT